MARAGSWPAELLTGLQPGVNAKTSYFSRASRFRAVFMGNLARSGRAQGVPSTK